MRKIKRRPPPSPQSRANMTFFVELFRPMFREMVLGHPDATKVSDDQWRQMIGKTVKQIAAEESLANADAVKVFEEEMLRMVLDEVDRMHAAKGVEG